MANATWYPMEGALASATERRTAYAAGTMNLFQDSLVPSPTTTQADFAAAVADYDTYAPAAVANFNTPILAETSGYLIVSPSHQFDTGATDPVVGNVIGGAWYEDAGGDVRLVTTFDPPIPMQVAHQGFELAFADVFPTGF